MRIERICFRLFGFCLPRLLAPRMSRLWLCLVAAKAEAIQTLIFRNSPNLPMQSPRVNVKSRDGLYLREDKQLFYEVRSSCHWQQSLSMYLLQRVVVLAYFYNTRTIVFSMVAHNITVYVSSDINMAFMISSGSDTRLARISLSAIVVPVPTSIPIEAISVRNRCRRLNISAT